MSDGSAFTIRTTSPLPVYRSTRDTRNAPLWNPSSKELLNVEEDEAGRLAGFRARFGMGFDAKKGNVETTATNEQDVKTVDKAPVESQQVQETQKDEFEEDDMNLLELISSFGQENAAHLGGGATGSAKGQKDKGKKGK